MGKPEVKEVVSRESTRVGRRDVAVEIRRVAITPADGEPFTVVDVNVVVGSFDFHMSVPEALEAMKMMSRLMPDATEADKRQKTWEARKRRERDKHVPDPSKRRSMGEGKTARKRRTR